MFSDLVFFKCNQLYGSPRQGARPSLDSYQSKCNSKAIRVTIALKQHQWFSFNRKYFLACSFLDHTITTRSDIWNPSPNRLFVTTSWFLLYFTFSYCSTTTQFLPHNFIKQTCLFSNSCSYFNMLICQTHAYLSSGEGMPQDGHWCRWLSNGTKPIHGVEARRIHCFNSLTSQQ